MYLSCKMEVADQKLILWGSGSEKLVSRGFKMLARLLYFNLCKL